MIASLNDDIQMAKDEAANEARLESNAVEMKRAAAIVAHKVMGETRNGTNLPDAFKDVGGAEGNWAISRTSGPAKITLNQSTPVADKDKYESKSVMVVDGYAGWEYTRDSMAAKRPVTEMAMIYTDIEEAGERAFGTDATTEIPFVLDDTHAKRLTGSAPQIPSPPTAKGASNTGAEVAPDGTFRADYYGVPGSVGCDGGGSACTISVDDEGAITLVGTLTFTPDSSTAKALYAKPDTDYTHFGYWLRSLTPREGNDTHIIETFHGGSGALSGGATPNLSPVLGTAKYYGSAAGQFVKKAGSGDELVVTRGSFTASAELMARFGGTSIAVDDQYEIEGTISDFKDGDKDDIGFADLMLGKAGMDTDANDPTVRPGTFEGETDGGGTSGNWSGQFYGNANPTPTGSTVTPVLTDDFPLNVSGEFNGHFVNGHVAGAFGAEKDE